MPAFIYPKPIATITTTTTRTHTNNEQQPNPKRQIAAPEKFTREEAQRLMALAAQYERHEWESVARELATGHSAIQVNLIYRYKYKYICVCVCIHVYIRWS